MSESNFKSEIVTAEELVQAYRTHLGSMNEV
jgi:hypothetical protein